MPTHCTASFPHPEASGLIYRQLGPSLWSSHAAHGLYRGSGSRHGGLSHNLMLNLLYCTLELLGLSPGVLWECGTFPCLWHWTFGVVSTVSRKQSRGRLWGAEVEGHGAGAVLHFLQLTASRQKSPIPGCCRDILTTPNNRRKVGKNPQRWKINPFTACPMDLSNTAFGGEEHSRELQETQTALQEAQGKVTAPD